MMNLSTDWSIGFKGAQVHAMDSKLIGRRLDEYAAPPSGQALPAGYTGFDCHCKTLLQELRLFPDSFNS